MTTTRFDLIKEISFYSHKYLESHVHADRMANIKKMREFVDQLEAIEHQAQEFMYTKVPDADTQE